MRIQSAEKKISFQKNGSLQDWNPVVPVFKGRRCDDFTHLLPFFVFLFVKYLCLPERRFVIGYIYKKEDCDCRHANADISCEVCRIAESLELFEYAPGVRDTNNLGAWWLESKMDRSLPDEIDEFFDYEGYGESIAENNDGEFVEGLGFVCMEEGYTLEDVLQDADQGMGGM